MARILKKEGFSFDDVLLVPKLSSVKSRFNREIDLSVQLTPKIKLDFPLISAAMDTITDGNMANAMSRLGGLGIIHRFMSDDKHNSECTFLDTSPHKTPKIVGIGLGPKRLERLHYITALQDVDAVHIDVAYAHTPMMFEFIKEIKEKYPSLDVIVGSIASGEGFKYLCDSGVDAIRVNVGGGSRCSTRLNTGNGFPALTALMECREVSDKYFHNTGKRVSVICDGGVKNAGDCVKGLAAGAHAIMSGYLFAATDETPGFLDYFYEATPVNEIGLMNIGSRPSHRKTGNRSKSSVRAIGWVFGWAQSRHTLPAWYEWLT